MTEHYRSPFAKLELNIPQDLSEIWDLLGSMVLSAPTFESKLFPERNLETEFSTLTSGFERVRSQFGEERYALLLSLASQAKELFAADPDDANGEADRGRAALFEIEKVVQEVRRARKTSRVKAKLKDEEGEVTGD